MTANPQHGELGYLQLPTTDPAASLAFYSAVFGWSGEAEFGSFEAPGLIGQFTPDLEVGSGPVLWMFVEDLYLALTAVTSHGGTVRRPPCLDQGARWLAEISDPCGTPLGLVAPRRTARSRTLLYVRDVEASSRWYQQLAGLSSGHGGPAYERLLADGELTLQLHSWDAEHHHGRIGDPEVPVGNGVLVWLGEVSDFDGVVQRAADLGVEIVREPHRNPPTGEGPSHQEIWVRDPDGYVVVFASPDGSGWGA
jgi:predicted enzyme related to lactoylglutathione lyase